MKKIKLYIHFEETGKTMEHTMSISDSLYKFLSLPYRNWGSDLYDYVVGKHEDAFHTHVFSIEGLILAGILDKKFGISQNEWVFADRNEEDGGNTIVYYVDIEK